MLPAIGTLMKVAQEPLFWGLTPAPSSLEESDMLAGEGGKRRGEIVEISNERIRKSQVEGDSGIRYKYTMKFLVPFLEMVGLEVAMPYGGQGGAS